MSLIPQDELRKATSLNLAPMVDFLFVIAAVFATMAMTRAVLHDTHVSLVKVSSHQKTSPTQEPFIVNIGITEQGKYKWMTEVNEFWMQSPQSIQKELQKQQQMGLISSRAEDTKILLHIDKNAPWEPVAHMIFALREQGFPVHPVYKPEQDSQ